MKSDASPQDVAIVVGAEPTLGAALVLTVGPGAGLGLVPGWSEHMVGIDALRYLRLRGGA